MYRSRTRKSRNLRKSFNGPLSVDSGKYRISVIKTKPRVTVKMPLKRSFKSQVRSNIQNVRIGHLDLCHYFFGPIFACLILIQANDFFCHMFSCFHSVGFFFAPALQLFRTYKHRIGLNYRIGPDRTRFSVLWSFFLRYFILYAQLEEVYSIQNYFYLTPSFQYKKKPDQT